MRMVKALKKYWTYYLLLLPAIAYVAIFNYGPLYGVQIAFKDYRGALGILGSRWVGLKHFLNFFESYNFWMLIENTFTLSLYSLAVGFPIPILLALMLNEIRQARLKKAVQTILYAPHFISTVVMVGILVTMLSPSIGVVNTLRARLGLERIYFMTQPSSFRHLYVWSGVWQGMGWSAVIYLSALSAVDPELHEAARIDGASRLMRIRHINIPAIQPTVVILFLLAIGTIMKGDFQMFWQVTGNNPMVLEVTDVIDTYVTRSLLQLQEFGMTSAAGLYQSTFSFLLVLLANKLVKKVEPDYALF